MSQVENIDIFRARFEERFETPSEVFWNARRDRYDSYTAPTALVYHQCRWEGWCAALASRSDIELIVRAVTEEIIRQS